MAVWQTRGKECAGNNPPMTCPSRGDLRIRQLDLCTIVHTA